MSTAGNNTLFLDSSNPGIVGLAGGNDRYVLSANGLSAGQQITISDAEGANTLQLAGGLAIASSQVSNNAIQLTLTNGAIVNVLNASTFTFLTGGDAFTGTGGLTQTYAQFVTVALGSTVPAAGATPVAVGPVTLVDPSVPVVPVSSFTLTTTATSVAEAAPIEFTLTGDVSAIDQTFNLVISGDDKNGTAGITKADAADFPADVVKTVVLLAGETSVNFTITPVANDGVEGAQGFKVSVLDSSFSPVVSSDTVVITDAVVVVPSSLNLTVGEDSIIATAAGQTFTAPVVQNSMGAQTNTLGDGDVIAGMGTGNKLMVDLTLTTAGAIPIGSAISAATNNIQIVELRAQTPIIDIGGVYPNLSHIDAENFNGVEQWWSVNSRSNMQVEDVRSRPEDTTIGMRNTDPLVDFRVYFGPDQLDENSRPVDSQLTLKVADIAAVIPGDLTNVPIDGLKFQLDGVSYTLRSTEIGAATTYAQFVAGLEAAIALQPALATLTVELNADNTITLTDTAGKPFTLGGWFFVNDSVPANGNIVFQQTVGDPSLVDVPISTNVVLDNVGRTSQGGDLDIGSLGEGGVAEFDVVVDRTSWVTSMQSNSFLGNGGGGQQTEHLESVTFTSTGANGNVTVGNRTNNLDGRVNNSPGGNSGLVDVREVDGSAFMGTMNLAIRLESGGGANNSIARYLNGATDPVEFSYKGGAQADIFNIFVDTNVSNDSDFRMDVDMGASDDRLILRGADKLNNISVDGGTGNNTFVTSTSVGFGVNPADIADHEFASFKNFQTYEVEANDNTAHDFTTMSGVEKVVIATTGVGTGTQLIDLEAAQNVTVTGKNQTLGNNSAADQNFGLIQLTNDAGVNRTITLENTARLSNSTNGVRQDGVLTVAALVIDTTPATAVGATRNVTIESEGVRTTANVVANFVGRDVEKLTLTGTQDLTINVNQMADQAANAAPGTNTSTSVQVNAAGLTGDLNLALNGGMLNNFGGVPPMPAQVDTVVGTSGSSDVLGLWNALTAGNQLRASAFETVQLGTFGPAFGNFGQAVNAAGLAIAGSTDTMFGDLPVALGVSGALNTANLGTSNFVIANVDDVAIPAVNADLQLSNLSGGTNVVLGDAARNVNGDRVANQLLTETLAFSSQAGNAVQTAGDLNLTVSGVVSNNVAGNALTLAVGDQVTDQTGVAAAANTGGFRTINLDLARDITIGAAASDANFINLAVGSQARTLDIDGGLAGKANTGTADTLVLGTQLLNSLEMVDISGYNGRVTLTMQQGPIAPAAQTDVTFEMSSYNANIILSDVGGTVASVAHNSIFDFNGAGTAAVPSVWTINNIVAAADSTVPGAATIVNTTLFDVSDLGIANFAGLDVIIGTGANFSLDGTVLAVGTAAIRSEAQGNTPGSETWEIKVIGVDGTLAAGDITAANFLF